MKRIHPEDPRITAHALGELPSGEAAELERAALLNPAVQEALDEARQLARLLGEVLGDKDLVLGEDRRETIRRAGRQPEVHELASASPYRRWGRVAAVMAAAAVLLVGGVWMLQQIPVTMFGNGGEIAKTPEEVRMRILLAPVDQPHRVARITQGTPVAPALSDDPGAEPAGESPDPEYLRLTRLLQEDPEAFFQDVRQVARSAAMRDLAELPNLVDNPFVSAREESRAVVPMVSGGASFPLVERFVRGEEKLPPRNAVRVEELINHVIYQDEGDAELDGIRLGAELVRCPWDERRLLLGVLLRNDSDKMLPVSKALRLDVKPDVIRSYRLLGYADTGSGGGAGLTAQRGLPPGWSNFVLYELNPAQRAVFTEHWVLVRAGLAVGEESMRGLIVPVTSPPRDWGNASPNFKTASVLAAYGMLLRDSFYKGGLEPTLVRELAEDAMRDVSTGDLIQREALQLVIDSESLLIAAGR
jgi:hypothetical protein